MDKKKTDICSDIEQSKGKKGTKGKKGIKGKKGFQLNNKLGGGRVGKNKATIYEEAVQEIGEDKLKSETQAVFDAMVIKAKQGDAAAAKIILDRTMPIVKCTKVKTGIRTIKTLEALHEAYDMILARIDDQELSLEEAEAIIAILERKSKIFEFAQIKKENEELRVLHEEIKARYMKK